MSTQHGKTCPGGVGSLRRALTHKLSVPRSEVFEVVEELAGELSTHFESVSSSSRFPGACARVALALRRMRPRVAELVAMAPRYDLDAQTPGNGYRSLVCIVDTALVRLLQLLRLIQAESGGYLFRTSHYTKELEAYASVVEFMASALDVMSSYTPLWPESDLFPPPESADTFHDLIQIIEDLDPACFYGRAIGFQFCSSVSKVFGVVGLALAAYSVSWEHNTGPLSSLLSSSKFLLSPELRARRIIDVVRHADISFCKGFWNLSEGQLMQQVPDWFCPRLKVVRELRIPAAEPLYLRRHAEAESIDGVTFAKIPPPAAHTGNRPVAVRLLSNRARVGMEKVLGGPAPSEAASPALLFHCHGGGFVATSSKSHETYLRYWAKVLDCPVLSIDYALAPENPFPRALEEILYAYVWAVNHSASLGWTGERICVAGDSAGGNLLMAMTIHLIEMGVARVPDGMMMAYAAFVFAYVPSPSRLLTVMDPLLPMGIILRCLAAYTGNSHLVENDVGPGENGKNRKTLQEYIDEMAKVPPTAVHGDQRIMSLVNLVSHSESANFATIRPPVAPQTPLSPEKRVKFSVNSEGIGESPPPTPTDDGTGSGRRRSKSERSSDSGSSGRLRRSSSLDERGSPPVGGEEEAEEDPVVEIHGDPSRIWLASARPDDQGIVGFLARHHLTKNSMLVCEDGGKAPLSASLSVRSLGFDAEEATPPPPPKPRMSLRRSLRSTMSATLNVATNAAMDRLGGWLETPETLASPGSLETKARGAAGADPTPPIARLRALKPPATNLISPLLTAPNVLARLPPVHIVAGQLDPLLDDSIAFAKKARSSGAGLVTVDLIDGLPHGFLNFTLPSPECRRGARLCLRRINGVLFPELRTPAEEQ